MYIGKVLEHLTIEDKKELREQLRKIFAKDGISLTEYREYMKSNEFKNECEILLIKYSLKEIKIESMENSIFIYFEDVLYCVHKHYISKIRNK